MSNMTPLLLLLLAGSLASAQFWKDLGKDIKQEIADINKPLVDTIAYIGSSQCSKVKKLVGVAYEQIDGEKEPDLTQLTLQYITRDYKITYNITTAAKEIPQSKHYDPHQKLIIFAHGFTEDPSKASFGNINKAFFSKGEYNVLGLDGSSLIRWLYLRSTTYVRFIGEKLGEVLASIVKSGVDPAAIHIIGHSLGAHISGFTGKTFTNLTGLRVGRISGLDPAGPCFSDVDDNLRLRETDAAFVDVMHTDGGVYGLTDAVGHVDYFPNNGEQQPNCLLQTCSHNRAWVYFSESVVNPEAFPAIKCKNWDAFKENNCEKEIRYMGYASEPSARGRYYLQTNGEAPYGRGQAGLKYRNEEGVIKSVINITG